MDIRIAKVGKEVMLALDFVTGTIIVIFVFRARNKKPLKNTVKSLRYEPLGSKYALLDSFRKGVEFFKTKYT